MNDNDKPSVPMRVALCFLIFCMFLLLGACTGSALKSEITVKVVDEDGNPIDKAKVNVGFYLNDSSKKGYGQERFTNSEGGFTSNGKSNGYVSFLAGDGKVCAQDIV